MKKLYMLLLCAMLSASLFAAGGGGGGDGDPPIGRLLVNDRIRNTVAVDPDESGGGIRFYVTTFGLEAFDPSDSVHTSRAPRPIPGSLVRFGILNSLSSSWCFGDTLIDRMDSECFNTQGTIPINCYSDSDRYNLDIEYSTELLFTDGTTGTEGHMRYESGTGFWASPVFYNNGGSKNLIVLNKSGCLMKISVDVTAESQSPTVRWKTDLREIERSNYLDSYKFEFMATPVLHNNKIYVVGIKMLHVVDLSSGGISQSLPCPNMSIGDYFEAPPIFDTADPENVTFYFISRLGRAFKFDGVSVMAYVNNLGDSKSPPLLDADGHVFFATKLNGVPTLSYVEQEIRTAAGSSGNMTVVNLSHDDDFSNIKSSVLTDFTKYKYMLTDNFVLWETGKYNFDAFSMSADPISFYDNEPTWNRSARLTVGCTRFPGNHAVLSYQNATNKTLIYSLSNRLSNGFGDDVLNYYPSTEYEYDLSNGCRGVSVSMACLDHSYPIPLVLTKPPFTSPYSTQTWGGIAPYKSTIMGWLNVVYGDEAGYIWSHPAAVNSSTIGYNLSVEDLEPDTVPEMGYTKYMKNIDNVPTNNEIDSSDIYFWGSDPSAESFVFANSYARELQRDSLSVAGSIIPVWKANFKNLLPNKQYRITWKDSEGETKYRENVTIPPEDNELIIISIDPDLVVPNRIPYSDVPDVETSWLFPSPLYYSTVTVEDEAFWRVGNGSKIYVDQLILGEKSRVTIGDGSMLKVNQVICYSPRDYAYFNLDGGYLGKLNVYGSVTNTVSSKLRFEGYNSDQQNYSIRTILNDTGASLLFQSCVANPPDRISTSINDLYNYGTVIVNDCVKLTCGYTDDAGENRNGVLKIGIEDNFGNLIWQIPKNINSYSSILSGFEVGHEDMTDPERATFTVVNDAECVFSRCGFTQIPYKVYGKMLIGDTSKCIVELAAVLQFMEGSKLSLEGDLDPNSNGAELFVTSGGIVRMEHDVSIVGRKPNPAPTDIDKHGDRIIIDAEGRIEGNDAEIIPNPRKLKNLSISTSHPNGLRWEGINIESEFNEDTRFELVSDNGSVISGIDKIYVKNSGNSPNYQGVVFGNCTYGVYSTTDSILVSPRVTTVDNCVFKNCTHGIYIVDKDLGGNQPNLKAVITGCQFGGEDEQAGNINGIALHRAADVKVNNCSFQRNGYGIFALNSSVLVGGRYNDEYPHQPVAEDSCQFHDNEKAGIYISQSADSVHKSLIMGNDFSGNHISNAYPGLGIWVDESSIDILNNTFSNLGGHGMLVNTYNWYTNSHYHGFANNDFQNNRGCELIGDATSLSTSAYGQNTFNDESYLYTGSVDDPLDNFDLWDQYILASLSGGGARTNVVGNIFDQNPWYNYDRFYPSYYAFYFGPPAPEHLTDIIVAGMNHFYQGTFDAATLSMKQAVENYPNEELTKLAIDYLYLITRASSEDYVSLRAYLDQKIPADSLVTHFKKEEIKTKCYIQEEEYLTAISRLQQVIDNPKTVADSLFALISQAYCVMNLAETGAKLPLNVSAKTRDFTSYLELLAELMSGSHSQFASSPTIPKVLTIESNYPNPFNPETTIVFSLPHDEKVKATVYNIRGQKVKQLLDEHLVAGKHTVIWNGTDSHGKSVASGVYFVKIKAGKQQRAHKMVLMK